MDRIVESFTSRARVFAVTGWTFTNTFVTLDLMCALPAIPLVYLLTRRSTFVNGVAMTQSAPRLPIDRDLYGKDVDWIPTAYQG